VHEVDSVTNQALAFRLSDAMPDPLNLSDFAPCRPEMEAITIMGRATVVDEAGEKSLNKPMATLEQAQWNRPDHMNWMVQKVVEIQKSSMYWIR
jgi:hypothetical protein